jgi:hypothetical protein
MDELSQPRILYEVRFISCDTLKHDTTGDKGQPAWHKNFATRPMNNRPQHTNETDVLLIGAGIMSATLGVLLKQLEPSWTIEIVERLDSAAQESSDAWNNAGTGHAAFCELNYTPEREDGSVDVSKA